MALLAEEGWRVVIGENIKGLSFERPLWVCAIGILEVNEEADFFVSYFPHFFSCIILWKTSLFW